MGVCSSRRGGPDTRLQDHEEPWRLRLWRLRRRFGGPQSLSREVKPPEPLSQYDQYLIKQTWLIIEDDKDLFGQIIFLRIFDSEPSLKHLFLWEEYPNEILCQNQKFRRHVMFVINIIEHCVRNIDKLQDKMQPRLLCLGRSHTRFQSYGFSPVYWDLFRLSILTSLTADFGEEKQMDDIQNAWNRLLTWVIVQMQTGYHHAISKLHQSSFRRMANPYLAGRTTASGTDENNASNGQ